MLTKLERNPRSSRVFGIAATLGSILLMAPPHTAHAHAVVTILHTFGSIPNDALRPDAQLTQGPDGIYGVTIASDMNGATRSTAFKYSTSGVYSVLHTFSDGTNTIVGGLPITPLTLGSDGNLYGVTTERIYRMTPTGTVTTVYTFNVATNGYYPSSGLIEDTPGIFFGTRSEGNGADNGTIYKITTAGVYSVVHNFLNSELDDGSHPIGRLIRASDGNYYGTTSNAYHTPGLIYKFTPTGVYSVLQKFPDTGSLGAVPISGVVEGPDGSLYGTTRSGGFTATNHVLSDYGGIFKVTKSGVITLVHVFGDNDTSDVLLPGGALMRDSNGIIYGTAQYDGSIPDYGGGIFQISPTGVYSVAHRYHASVEQLHSLTGVIQGADGSVYGTTLGQDGKFGAPSTQGTLYKIAFFPDPTVTQISPDTAPSGLNSLALTVTGANFYPGATIYLNGSPLPTTMDSLTQLRATVTVYEMQSPGSLNITVGYPYEGQSSPLTLTITPRSTLTSLSPNTVQAGSIDFTFAINGTGFVSGAKVVFNGAYITTHYVTPTQLTATVPRGYLTTPAAANVTVINPNTIPDAPLPFTVTGPAVPARCAPSTVQAGHVSFNLSIVGTGFTSSTKAYWNGTLLTTYFISSTQIVVTVPAAFVAAPTTATITVTPTTPATTPISFPVTAAPVFTGMTPSTTTAGHADFTLTTIGTGFVVGAQITWNGTPLTTTYVSPTNLTATIPAALVTNAGTATLKVINPGVAPTGPRTFTITP
jgi:uncharacterized repeat protein (TIGR03803 family)